MLHSCGVGIQLKLNSFAHQNFLKLGGNLRILARHNLPLLVNDCDLAAKPAKHLPKFKPDISSAKDDQMFWRFPQFHDALVREHLGGIEPRNNWNGRAAARIDENFFGFEER